MLLSLKWLREFVPVEAGAQEVGDRLTMLGLELEDIIHPYDAIKDIVVGHVLTKEAHPDSDHLAVCTVDAGQEEVLNIVCGAPNVAAGQKVPVALVGTTMPGGMVIKKAKLRGVPSFGMICSERELGLSEDHNGIMVLPKGFKVGTRLIDALDLDTEILEIGITPNRGDCLSVLGLAREAALAFKLPLTLPKVHVEAQGADWSSEWAVNIPNPDLCPFYQLRLVEGVTIRQSPMWMRHRLHAVGVRPISNIVDVTNYILMELGQPLHAFDRDKLEGGRTEISVARDGERIVTLDGQERVLTSADLLIRDGMKPVALAGVMGGANSEIVGDTAMVVFEGANFNGTSIRRTAAALGMRTEASGRFEKGLDPMNTVAAVDRACELVELLGCGEVMRGTIDVLPEPIVPKTVKLEPDKVNGLLGTDVSKAEMRRILLALGFELDGDTIIVPSWRGDVEHYSDIAEEVARFHGYNAIPDTLATGLTQRRGFNPTQKAENRVGDLCRSAGYNEIITYSFISPSYYDKIDLPKDSPLRDSLKILNPLGEDTSIMRTTILPSLLEILARNYSFRNPSARLYELGRTYFKRPDGLADEPKVLSLGAYGDGYDFFTLKGAVETVLDGLRIPAARYVADRTNPSYHPGRCAKVYVGEKCLGTLGQVHPHVAANYGVDCELYAAELDFAALLSVMGPDPVYRPLPRFPAVSRDIAVVCDRAIPVGDLEECIRRGAKGLLKAVELFDIYTGIGVPEGKKSVAFRLTLRSDDRSLTAEEADTDVKSVLAALESELGARLR